MNYHIWIIIIINNINRNNNSNDVFIFVPVSNVLNMIKNRSVWLILIQCKWITTNTNTSKLNGYIGKVVSMRWHHHMASTIRLLINANDDQPSFIHTNIWMREDDETIIIIAFLMYCYLLFDSMWCDVIV